MSDFQDRMRAEITRRTLLKAAGAGAFTLSAGALIAACGGGTSSGTTQTQKPLVIGMTMPLSGSTASVGQQVQYAVRAWLKQVNASGGILHRQVQVNIQDDAGVPSTAVVGYTQMLDSGNTDFIIGTYPTTVEQLISTLAEQRQMVFLCSGGYALALYTRGYQYLFQTLTSTSDGALTGDQAFLDSLPQQSRPSTMALVSADQVGAIGTLTGAKTYLTSVKTIFEDHYPLTATDLTPLVQRVKAANADMLVHSGLPADSVAFAQAIANSGYKPKLTLYDSQGQQLGNLASAGAEGIVYFTWFDVAMKAQGLAEFVSQYKTESNGGPIYPWSSSTYASLQILDQAITATTSTKQDIIRDYIRSHTFHTVAGDLSFDAKGINKDQHTILVQWQKGKGVVIWPKSVANGTFVPAQ